MSWPLEHARAPPSSGVKPEMRSNSVVLPAPLGPMIPRISPGATSDDTSSRARMPPKLPASSLGLERGRHRRSSRRRCCRDARRGPARPSPPLRPGASRRADAAPSRNTERSMSGRSSSSAVGPVEADLALLHEVGGLGDRERDVHRLLDEDDRRARCRAGPARSAAAARRSTGASPSDSSSIISSLGRGEEGHAQGEHLLLATGQVGRRLVEPLSAARGRTRAPARDRHRRRRPCLAACSHWPIRRFSRTVRSGRRPRRRASARCRARRSRPAGRG